MSGFRLKSSSNSTDTNYINTLIDEKQRYSFVTTNGNITTPITICKIDGGEGLSLTLPPIGAKQESFKVSYMINSNTDLTLNDYPHRLTKVENFTQSPLIVDMPDTVITVSGTITLSNGVIGDFLGVCYIDPYYVYIINLRGTNEKVSFFGIHNNGNYNNEIIQYPVNIIYVLPSGQDKMDPFYSRNLISRSDTVCILSSRINATFVSDPVTKTWYAT